MGGLVLVKRRPVIIESFCNALGDRDGRNAEPFLISANGDERNIRSFREFLLRHMLSLTGFSHFYHITTSFNLFGKFIIYLFG